MDHIISHLCLRAATIVIIVIIIIISIVIITLINISNAYFMFPLTLAQNPLSIYIFHFV